MKYLILVLFFFYSLTTIAEENNQTISKNLNIVASFSILQDITQNIVKDIYSVKTIIPNNTDAHSYNLTPQNLIDIEKADLIVINGLGFEGFLERFLHNKKNDNRIVIASNGISTIALEDDSENNKVHLGFHANESTDPHAWQNPLNVIIFVNNIVQKLCDLDVDNCENFKENAKVYNDKLTQLNNKYSEIFKTIPKEQRFIITTHDAFSYLSKQYDIQIFSPLGLDSNSEVTASNLIKIKKLIEESPNNTIFLENAANNQILNNLSKSAHKTLSNKIIYADSLSKAAPANTYLNMLEYNLKTISDSMLKQ